MNRPLFSSPSAKRGEREKTPRARMGFRMTPPAGVSLQAPQVNWRNFRIACRLAERCGVTTAMFTGKGFRKFPVEFFAPSEKAKALAWLAQKE